MSLFDDWNADSQGTGFSVPSESVFTQPQFTMPTLEQTHVPPATSNQLESIDQPKFRIERLPWEPRREYGTLTCMCAGNNILLIGTSNNYLIRWNVETDEIQEVIVTNKKDESIHNVYIHPAGDHSIISMVNGTNYYYIPGPRTKPILLAKLKGHVVVSVAWYGYASDGKVQRFLVGTTKGVLWDVAVEDGKEKSCKKLFELRDTDQQPISGVRVLTLDAASLAPTAGAPPAPVGPTTLKLFVLLCTPSRLYQFFGYHTVDALFARYTTNPSFLELPGNSAASQIACYCPPGPASHERWFAWLTAAGVYQGELLRCVDHREEGVRDCTLLDCPAHVDEDEVRAMVDAGVGLGTSLPTQRPLAIAATEYHVLVLHRQRLSAINILSQQVSFEAPLPLKEVGVACTLAGDSRAGTYWVLTDRSVLEVHTQHERSGAWRMFLARGDFEAAYTHCPSDRERKAVLVAQAEDLFARGAYVAAAEIYPQTDLSFEGIALKFMQAYSESGAALVTAVIASGAGGGSPALGQRLFAQASKSKSECSSAEAMRCRHNIQLGLRYLLTSQLNKLQPEERTQLTLACAWLVELFLDSIHSLDTAVADADSAGDTPLNGAAAGLRELRAELYQRECQAFQDFLEEYHDCLHPATTLALISSFGRDKELLLYANLIGDVGLVVDHYIRKGDTAQALRALHALKDKLRYSSSAAGAPVLPPKDCELIYRVVPLLVPYAPAATVDMLIAMPGLDASRMLGALVRCGIQCKRPAHARSALVGVNNAALAKLGLSGSLAQTVDGAMSRGRDTVRELTFPTAHTALELSAEAAAYAGEVIRYLAHVLFHPTTGAPAVPQCVHHLYLCLLARAHREQELLDYISTPRFKHAFDHLFLLRLCRNEGSALIRVAVAIYQARHMYTEAIYLALTHDAALARQVLVDDTSALSDKPALLKRLWLSYAKVRVTKGVSVRAVLADVKSGNGGVSLSNLLQCLPGVSTMADVREEVLLELDGFAQDIALLKQEMEALTESNDKIRQAAEGLTQQAGSVTSNQCCDICGQPALLSSFLYFGCTHVFHVTCAVRHAKAYLDSNAQRRHKILEELLEEWLSNVSNKQGTTERKRTLTLDTLSAEEHNLLVEEFAQSECCLCGRMMIDSIGEPFIDEVRERDEIAAWKL